MTFALARTLPGWQPVACTSDTVFLCGRGQVARASHDLSTIDVIARLPDDIALARLRLRIVDRVFRTGIQTAAMLDDGQLLLARRSKIWRVDPQRGTVTLDFVIPQGRNVLSLARIVDEGGNEYIAFGDYFANKDAAPVSLWRRAVAPAAQWEQGTSFGAGTIDHVHGLHQLKDGRIVVMAGDVGAAAGIWQTNAALDTITVVRAGEQGWRVCWLHETAQGEVLSATDTQYEKNVFQRIDLDRGERTVLAELPGSCIYAARVGDSIVFSTAVEPGDSTGSTLGDILTRTPGPGIVGDSATIQIWDGALHTVLSAKKDAWPMRLAQFGTFQFPTGTMPADRFYAWAVGVDRYDGNCLMFERDA